MSGQLEAVIKKSILQYLHTVGVFSFMYLSGGYFDPRVGRYKKVHSKLSPTGIPDILGIFSYKNVRGIFLAIEVKTSTGVVAPHQKAMIEKINNIGGIAFVARSIDDVRLKLSEKMNEIDSVT